jgi:DNA-directed RNA polymerase specialized sigma subunit
MVKKHYVDNKRFEKLIKAYLKDKKTNEEELMSMFDKLISNIIDSFGFNVDKDDAKQECFVLILKTLKNFNPQKGKAFNFFTTIILNNLKLLYTKNKKYNEKISNYIERVTGQHPSSL